MGTEGKEMAEKNGRHHVASEAGHREGGEAPDSHEASGFVPIVGEAGPTARRGDGRRTRAGSHFVETDPYDLSGKRSGNPRKRIGRVVSVILFVIGVGLVLVAAGMWAKTQWEYHQQDVENERLAAYATVSSDPATAPVVDWAALKAINADVVGWVQIPGTVVSFPVYQAADNDRYLHTNADGDYSLGGQVFMDCENEAPGLTDMQTIIYGHHLRNGAMFKPVADMDNQQAFDGVSTVWYVTETATYELRPLFLYYTDGNDENVRRFNFDSEDEFRQYLQGLLAKAKTSASDAATAIGGTSHVLTLGTCNYIDGYGRTILVCAPKAEADATPAASQS